MTSFLPIQRRSSETLDSPDLATDDVAWLREKAQDVPISGRALPAEALILDTPPRAERAPRDVRDGQARTG